MLSVYSHLQIIIALKICLSRNELLDNSVSGGIVTVIVLSCQIFFSRAGVITTKPHGVLDTPNQFTLVIKVPGGHNRLYVGAVGLSNIYGHIRIDIVLCHWETKLPWCHMLFHSVTLS